MKNESENSKAFNELMSDAPAGQFDLAPGLSAEEMKAIFFDEDALIEAPEKIYRLNGGKHRYYYKFDEAGEPIFFTSVTTMIKQTMPTSPHLIKWIADMGYDESQNYAQDRADYGTFMHAEIAELLITQRYDMNNLKSKLKDYIEKEKLPQDFINYADDFKKDILAFAQFMIDCKVKPLAVEIVLAHPTDGYAGAIDLVCEMTLEISDYWGVHYKTGAQAGEPKKTKKECTFMAIVDFKSGRKGFYEEHEVQLQAYHEMWQLAYPEKKVERYFNWSPKDWRGTTPTYNLKDQSEANSRAKLAHLVELARIENDRKNNVVTLVEGVIDLKKGLGSNVTEMSLSELVKKRQAEKDKANNK